MKRVLPFVVCAMALAVVACKESGPAAGGAASGEPGAKPPAAASTPATPEQTKPAENKAAGFKEGELYPVKKGGKYGFIDHTGKMVIEPAYTGAYRFVEGLALVLNDKKRFGFIDRQGKVVIDFKYTGVQPFSEGLATVWIGQDASVIDKTGKAIIESKETKFRSISKFVNGVASASVFREVRQIRAVDSGYIDTTGKFLVVPQFDGASPMVDGLGAVRRVGQRWSFINIKGETVLPPKYEQAGQFSEGLAPVQTDAGGQFRWGYIDKTGNIAITPRFSQARFFNDGMAGVQINMGKFGYINRTGDLVIKDQYDNVDQFIDGIAMVEVGTKMGYIDKTGKYLWQPSE